MLSGPVRVACFHLLRFGWRIASPLPEHPEWETEACLWALDKFVSDLYCLIILCIKGPQRHCINWPPWERSVDASCKCTWVLILLSQWYPKTIQTTYFYKIYENIHGQPIKDQGHAVCANEVCRVKYFIAFRSKGTHQGVSSVPIKCTFSTELLFERHGGRAETRHWSD